MKTGEKVDCHSNSALYCILHAENIRKSQRTASEPWQAEKTFAEMPS